MNNEKLINIIDIYNGKYFIIFKEFVISDGLVDRFIIKQINDDVFIDETDIDAVIEEWTQYLEELLPYLSNNIDDFSYHEVLDRTHVVMTMLNSTVYEHIVTQMHPNIKNKVSEITSSLYDLYTMVGGIIDKNNK